MSVTEQLTNRNPHSQNPLLAEPLIAETLTFRTRHSHHNYHIQNPSLTHSQFQPLPLLTAYPVSTPPPSKRIQYLPVQCLTLPPTQNVSNVHTLTLSERIQCLPFPPSVCIQCLPIPLSECIQCLPLLLSERISTPLPPRMHPLCVITVHFALNEELVGCAGLPSKTNTAMSGAATKWS